MINVEVSQENLKKPEVFQALMKLLESLNVPLNIEPEPVKRSAKPKRNALPKVKLDIDEDVTKAYGKIITKPKSQFFLTLVKSHGRISSDEVQDAFQQYFNNFERKGIGGITGALRRWSQAEGVALPFEHEKDQHGTQYFRWVGIPPELLLDRDDEASDESAEDASTSTKLSDTKKKALREHVASHHQRYVKHLNKLLTQGSLNKSDLKTDKGEWMSFLTALTSFDSTLFSTSGDSVLLVVAAS